MKGELPPKFLCDEMLRKLARWLRMMGFDTTYPHDLDDRGIAELSIREGRTLLTRDKDLSNMRGVCSLRILSDDIDEQLSQVVTEMDIPNMVPQTTRCPSCNGELIPVDTSSEKNKREMSARIPDDVLTSYDTVFLCTICDKAYWTGSHWERIIRRMNRLGFEPRLPQGP